MRKKPPLEREKKTKRTARIIGQVNVTRSLSVVAVT
jgi:hypothetical protein